MGKTGWQAVAFVGIGLSFLLGGFALNTKNALEAANAQLRDQEPAPVPECEPAPNYMPGAFDPSPPIGPDVRKATDRCIGGTLLRKTGDEWHDAGPC